MLISSTPRARAQLRTADTTNDSPKPYSSQLLAPSGAMNCQAPETNRPVCLALLCAGLLLSCVSVALAAQAGWHRGVSQAESAVWAVAGVALAIVSLTGLAAAVSSGGTMRRTAFGAWLLALAFVVTAGLGSQHGGRELATRADAAATGDRARHEAAYKRASTELAALPAARPAGVIENELAVLLKDSRLKDCTGWLESKRLRTICVEKVEPMRAEQSIAHERQRLQEAMDDASAALSAAKPSKPANGDAAALQRYLALVGINLTPDRIADWLNLLAVMAVEVVGAVALALGRQQSLTVAAQPRQSWTADSSPVVNSEAGSAPAEREPVQPGQPVERPSPRGGLAVGSDADRRRARVVQKLLDGALVGTQESIAGRLGLPKTTMRRLVEMDSRLRLTVGPQGSRLELANA